MTVTLHGVFTTEYSESGFPVRFLLPRVDYSSVSSVL
jgi:hypothetical protein